MVIEYLSRCEQLQEQRSLLPLRRALKGMEGNRGVGDREAGCEAGGIELEASIWIKGNF